MKKAILYIRVSTDEQADKGYSQRNQDEVLHKYCALKSIQVADVVYEDHSAKTFNRPQWNKLLGRLAKLKGTAVPELILFTKWDRFSRNTGDAYGMIARLRGLGTEPQAIEQPLDLEIPENKMMLAFYLAAPEVENDRRALNIFHGMRRAKKEGRWVASAPVGYVNRTTENGRKYIRPSLPQADIIKEAFAELSTGKYAVDQVWKLAKKKGLACGSKNFRNVIRNPVYCGKIVVPAYRDEPPYLADGQHEPLITAELFSRVQDVLDGKRVKGTKIVSPDKMPLRGFLICPKCGRMLTGSASKGRNGYYHYYHCTSSCGVRFPAGEVNRVFEELLKKMVTVPAFRSLFKEIARDVFKQRSSGRQQRRQQIALKMETLASRLRKARELLLSGELDTPDYQSVKTEHEAEIGSLQTELDGLPDTDASITKLLNRYAARFLRLYDLYSGAVSGDRRRLVSLLFTKPLTYHDGHFQAVPAILSPAVAIVFKTAKEV